MAKKFTEPTSSHDDLRDLPETIKRLAPDFNKKDVKEMIRSLEQKARDLEMGQAAMLGVLGELKAIEKEIKQLSPDSEDFRAALQKFADSVGIFVQKFNEVREQQRNIGQAPDTGTVPPTDTTSPASSQKREKKEKKGPSSAPASQPAIAAASPARTQKRETRPAPEAERTIGSFVKDDLYFYRPPNYRDAVPCVVKDIIGDTVIFQDYIDGGDFPATSKIHWADTSRVKGPFTEEVLKKDIPKESLNQRERRLAPNPVSDPNETVPISNPIKELEARGNSEVFKDIRELADFLHTVLNDQNPPGRKSARIKGWLKKNSEVGNQLREKNMSGVREAKDFIIDSLDCLNLQGNDETAWASKQGAAKNLLLSRARTADLPDQYVSTCRVWLQDFIKADYGSPLSISLAKDNVVGCERDTIVPESDKTEKKSPEQAIGDYLQVLHKRQDVLRAHDGTFDVRPAICEKNDDLQYKRKLSTNDVITKLFPEEKIPDSLASAGITFDQLKTGVPEWLEALPIEKIRVPHGKAFTFALPNGGEHRATLLGASDLVLGQEVGVQPLNGGTIRVQGTNKERVRFRIKSITPESGTKFNVKFSAPLGQDTECTISLEEKSVPAHTPRPETGPAGAMVETVDNEAEKKKIIDTWCYDTIYLPYRLSRDEEDPNIIYMSSKERGSSSFVKTEFDIEKFIADQLPRLRRRPGVSENDLIAGIRAWYADAVADENKILTATKYRDQKIQKGIENRRALVERLTPEKKAAATVWLNDNILKNNSGEIVMYRESGTGTVHRITENGSDMVFDVHGQARWIETRPTLMKKPAGIEKEEIAAMVEDWFEGIDKNSLPEREAQVPPVVASRSALDAAHVEAVPDAVPAESTTDAVPAQPESTSDPLLEGIEKLSPKKQTEITSWCDNNLANRLLRDASDAEKIYFITPQKNGTNKREDFDITNYLATKLLKARSRPGQDQEISPRELTIGVRIWFEAAKNDPNKIATEGQEGARTDLGRTAVDSVAEPRGSVELQHDLAWKLNVEFDEASQRLTIGDKQIDLQIEGLTCNVADTPSASRAGDRELLIMYGDGSELKMVYKQNGLTQEEHITIVFGGNPLNSKPFYAQVRDVVSYFKNEVQRYRQSIESGTDPDYLPADYGPTFEGYDSATKELTINGEVVKLDIDDSANCTVTWEERDPVKKELGHLLTIKYDDSDTEIICYPNKPYVTANNSFYLAGESRGGGGWTFSILKDAVLDFIKNANKVRVGGNPGVPRNDRESDVSPEAVTQVTASGTSEDASSPAEDSIDHEPEPRTPETHSSFNYSVDNDTRKVTFSDGETISLQIPEWPDFRYSPGSTESFCLIKVSGGKEYRCYLQFQHNQENPESIWYSQYQCEGDELGSSLSVVNQKQENISTPEQVRDAIRNFVVYAQERARIIQEAEAASASAHEAPVGTRTIEADDSEPSAPAASPTAPEDWSAFADEAEPDTEPTTSDLSPDIQSCDEENQTVTLKDGEVISLRVAGFPFLTTDGGFDGSGASWNGFALSENSELQGFKGFKCGIEFVYPSNGDSPYAFRYEYKYRDNATSDNDGDIIDKRKENFTGPAGVKQLLSDFVSFVQYQVKSRATAPSAESLVEPPRTPVQEDPRAQAAAELDEQMIQRFSNPPPSAETTDRAGASEPPASTAAQEEEPSVPAAPEAESTPEDWSPIIRSVDEVNGKITLSNNSEVSFVVRGLPNFSVRQTSIPDGSLHSNDLMLEGPENDPNKLRYGIRIFYNEEGIQSHKVYKDEGTGRFVLDRGGYASTIQELEQTLNNFVRSAGELATARREELATAQSARVEAPHTTNAQGEVRHDDDEHAEDGEHGDDEHEHGHSGGHDRGHGHETAPRPEKSKVIDIDSKDILQAVGPELARFYIGFIDINTISTDERDKSRRIAQLKEEFKELFDRTAAVSPEASEKIFRALREQGYGEDGNFDEFKTLWKDHLSDKVFAVFQVSAQQEFAKQQVFSLRDETNASAGRRAKQGLAAVGIIGGATVLARLTGTTRIIGSVAGGVVGALGRRFLSTESRENVEEQAEEIPEAETTVGAPDEADQADSEPQQEQAEVAKGSWLTRTLRKVTGVVSAGAEKLKTGIKNLGVEDEKRNRERITREKRREFIRNMQGARDNFANHKEDGTLRSVAAWISQGLRDASYEVSAGQQDSGLDPEMDSSIYCFQKEALAALAEEYEGDDAAETRGEREARLGQLVAGLQENFHRQNEVSLDTREDVYKENNSWDQTMRELQGGVLWANDKDKNKRKAGLILSVGVGVAVGLALGEAPGDTRNVLLATGLGLAGFAGGKRGDLEARRDGFKKRMEKLYDETVTRLNKAEASFATARRDLDKSPLPKDIKKLAENIHELAAALKNDLFDPELAIEVRDVIHRARKLYLLTGLELEQANIQETSEEQIKKLTGKTIGWRKFVYAGVGAALGLLVGKGIEYWQNLMGTGQTTGSMEKITDEAGTTPEAETGSGEPAAVPGESEPSSSSSPEASQTTPEPANDGRSTDGAPSEGESSALPVKDLFGGLVANEKLSSTWALLDHAREIKPEGLNSNLSEKWEELTKSNAKFSQWRTEQLKSMGYVEGPDGKWGHPFTVQPGATLHVVWDQAAHDGKGAFAATYENHDLAFRKGGGVHFRDLGGERLIPKPEVSKVIEGARGSVKQFVADVKNSTTMPEHPQPGPTGDKAAADFQDGSPRAAQTGDTKLTNQQIEKMGAKVPEKIPAPAHPEVRGMMIDADLAAQISSSGGLPGVIDAQPWSIPVEDQVANAKLSGLAKITLVGGKEVIVSPEWVAGPKGTSGTWKLHSVEKSPLATLSNKDFVRNVGGSGGSGGGVVRPAPEGTPRMKFYEEYQKQAQPTASTGGESSRSVGDVPKTDEVKVTGSESGKSGAGETPAAGGKSESVSGATTNSSSAERTGASAGTEVKSGGTIPPSEKTDSATTKAASNPVESTASESGTEPTDAKSEISDADARKFGEAISEAEKSLKIAFTDNLQGPAANISRLWGQIETSLAKLAVTDPDLQRVLSLKNITARAGSIVQYIEYSTGFTPDQKLLFSSFEENSGNTKSILYFDRPPVDGVNNPFTEAKALVTPDGLGRSIKISINGQEYFFTVDGGTITTDNRGNVIYSSPGQPDHFVGSHFESNGELKLDYVKIQK